MKKADLNKLVKYMTGGTKNPTVPRKEDDKDKKLTKKQVNNINESTGISFTEEGANYLFSPIEPTVIPERPNVKLGRYDGHNYFNVRYVGNNVVIEPTTNNPQNAVGFRDQIDYIKSLNPNISFSEDQTYVNFSDRGVNSYNIGGEVSVSDCPPGDIECQKRKAMEASGLYLPQSNSNSIGDLQGPTLSGLSLQENIDRGERLQREAIENDKIWSGTEETTVTPKRSNVAALSVMGDFTYSNGQNRPGVTNPADVELVQSPDTEFQAKTVEEQKEDKLIYNPYKGVDLEGAIMAAGMGFGSGNNSLGAAGAGLSALKLARLGMAGYGIGNASKEAKEDGSNKNFNTIFAKKGGEIPGTITGDPNAPYNSEVEDGEHIKDNYGNVEEVVGKKHEQGGEKMMLEAKEQIISDHLKIGKENVKFFKENLGVNVKPKDTYATVQDKINKKYKTKQAEEEKQLLIEKMESYTPTGHSATDMVNTSFYKGKLDDIEAELQEINKKKEEAFDLIFTKQEESKPKKEETPKENSYFNLGGVKDEDIIGLAEKYDLTKEEALKIIQDRIQNGDPIKGVKTQGGDAPEERYQTQNPNRRVFGSVTEQDIVDFKNKNSFWYDFTDFDPTNEEDVKDYQKAYNERTGGNKLRFDGKFGEETAGSFLNPIEVGQTGNNVELDEVVVTAKGAENNQPTEGYLPSNDQMPNQESEYGFLNMGMDVQLPPRELQAVLKQQARRQRYNAQDIDVNPYLETIRAQNRAADISDEGLAPELRAAVRANRDAASLSQENRVRNQIDSQNRQNRQQVYNANVDQANQEYALNNQYDLNYEQRMFGALENTYQDIDNYFNTLNSNNQQRSQFIENMNLLNQQNEDIYFDGSKFRRRKSSTDKELLQEYLRNIELRK